MKVENLMTRDAATCGLDDKARSAAAKLRELDIGALPVLDADGRVCGMVTDRDLLMSVFEEGRKLDTLRVADAMSEGATTCRPDDDLGDVLRAMRDARVRRIPVVDEDHRPVGLVSENDLVRHVAERAGREGGAVLAQEVIECLATVAQPMQTPRA